MTNKDTYPVIDSEESEEEIRKKKSGFKVLKKKTGVKIYETYKS